MQFPGQNNISFTLVGKNLSSVTNATVITGTESLSDGAVCLVDKDNKVISTTGTLTADQVIRFVQRSGTTLKYTPYFTVKNASVKLSSYAAGVEQVSYIGYNGTSGSLDVIDNTYFTVWVNLLQAYNGTTYMKDITYKSAKTSATQAQIATGLYDAAIRSFGREPYKYITFDRVSDGTRTQFSAGTGDATSIILTNNSTTVTYNGSTGVQTALTVGQAIKIKGVLYYVVTSSTTSFTIDYAYTGVSETLAFTNSTTGTYASITAYGLKLTGVAQTFQLDKLSYGKVKFTLTLKGFTATSATYTTDASNGTGVYEQVAELERFSDFNFGKTLRGYYLASDDITLDAASAATYEVATINAKKYTPTLNGDIPSPLTIYLCFYKDSGQGDDIATRLNSYYGSGAFA